MRVSPHGVRVLLQDTIALVCSLNESFDEAAHLLERALAESDRELALRVQILVSLSFALVNAGRAEAALQRAEDAVKSAAELGDPHALSQALGMQVVLRFMFGGGLDAQSLQRALDLEDRRADISSAFSPSVQHALLLAWTGNLDRAHEEMLSIRRRCIDQGEESELSFIDFHSVLIHLWRGSTAEANLIAEDAVERALQLNADLPLSVALTVPIAAARRVAGDAAGIC
jgi:tetratricopeptide (TPR) repeat protein